MIAQGRDLMNKYTLATKIPAFAAGLIREHFAQQGHAPATHHHSHSAPAHRDPMPGPSPAQAHHHIQDWGVQPSASQAHYHDHRSHAAQAHRGYQAT